MHDVEVKLDRAWFHQSALDTEFQVLCESGAYDFKPEVRDKGREHIYRSINPPPVRRYWSVQLGESVHALRSALEHLARQLVIANKGAPNDWTHFPICSRRPRDRFFKHLSHPRRTRPLKIRGGVPREALELIKAVQPYTGTDEGRRLLGINRLDIFDEHRELVVVVSRGHTSSTWGTVPLPESRKMFTGQPVEHNNVVARGSFLRHHFAWARDCRELPTDLSGGLARIPVGSREPFAAAPSLS